VTLAKQSMYEKSEKNLDYPHEERDHRKALSHHIQNKDRSN
jgi:hypothetical protein